MTTAKKANRKKTPRAVPAIRPREPLTRKARAAIKCYVLVRCGPAKIIDYLVDYTLEAERMYRSKLYEWLEDKGYRWSPRLGWRSTKGSGEGYGPD